MSKNMDKKLLLLETIKKSQLLPDEAKISLLEKLTGFSDEEVTQINNFLNWEMNISKNKDMVLRNILLLTRNLFPVVG